MLDMAAESGLSIADMKRQNELSRIAATDLDKGLDRLWQVMNDCIDRGLVTEGILPGGLHVKRRAKGINDAPKAEAGVNLTAPHTINDWMSTYAMAVNEENAAGGQVVTAPTNGAAGVVPATIRLLHGPCAQRVAAKIPDFLLTASAIGGLVKFNAVHQRCRSGMSGRSWFCGCNGGGGSLCCSWRHAPSKLRTPPKLRSSTTLA